MNDSFEKTREEGTDRIVCATNVHAANAGTTTKELIEAAIPHRGAMLLIDEIVERSTDRIVCRKTFRPDEFFFQGHYPNYPLVPGVILCECAMQAGAVLLAAHTSGAGRIPVATRLNDVRWKRMVRPGETVELDVTLNERMAGAFFLTAKVTCGGKIAASLSFACTMAAPPEIAAHASSSNQEC